MAPIVTLKMWRKQINIALTLSSGKSTFSGENMAQYFGAQPIHKRQKKSFIVPKKKNQKKNSNHNSYAKYIQKLRRNYGKLWKCF